MKDKIVSDPTGIKRERWATPFDFLIACVGCAVGFGNVWRFPYLVYRNGGGAFLIPFFISVLAGGISVFFLEVILGQFMSGGALKVWKIAPLFQGIGLAALVILFFENCYYNILLTWSFRYLFASFTSQLPWTTCNNDWNTDRCVEGTAVEVVDVNNKTLGFKSAQNVTYENSTQLSDSVVEYWERNVLGLSDSIEDIGSIKLDLLFCLIFAWIVVFACIAKGIRTSGRVMYFTATAPYAIILILLVRGLMLPGAMDGLEFYLKPNFSKLGELRVWADAGTQVFFSYCISIGVLNAFGSYNPWHHNSLRDSILFSIVDNITCIIAGFVIFPVLGYMAHEQNIHISDVAEQGPGLVFVVYPKAVSLMPAAPVWAVLFFTMLILVGIDCQFCDVEGFVAAIEDFLPKPLVKNGWRRAGVTAFVCFVNFLIGLTMITNGGMYIFQILDYYSGCRIIMLVACAECLVLGWVYGAERFCKTLEMMWQKPLWWPVRLAIKIMWKYVTPIYVMCQFILNSYVYSNALTYRRNANVTYEFPPWAIGLGWTLAYSSVLCIPLVAIIKITRVKGPLMERIRHLMKPVLKPYMVLPDDKPDTYLLDVDNDDVEECVPMNHEYATEKPKDAFPT